MNQESFELCEKIIPSAYVRQGMQCHKSLENKIRHFIEKKKLPDDGWDEKDVETLINELSLMDSNNFPDKSGVGEREARIFSNIVAKRHFYLGHGIGRSGYIADIQPKAAGSSILMKLTNSMVVDLLKLAGVSGSSCFVVPMATGMSLVLCMLSLRQKRPNGKYVLWPRIDQKSCIKSMSSAGFEMVVIENIYNGDELTTDLESIHSKIVELSPENILCILTTTSCFAPRVPDKLVEIGEMCKTYDIPHIVNNAYGVQSSKCMHLIQQAHRTGRVDAFVQSADKNLLVPVGGSIIAGFDSDFIEEIGKTYPGRASVTPTLDIFITLLQLGQKGYKGLLKQRAEVFAYLKEELEKCAQRHDERLLCTPKNPISMAITLTCNSDIKPKRYTELGSMLFTRNVSGARVVTSSEEKNICNHKFDGFGAHTDSYPTPYLTAAAAIGMDREEVTMFIKKLDKVITKWKSDNQSIFNKESEN